MVNEDVLIITSHIAKILFCYHNVYAHLCASCLLYNFNKKILNIVKPCWACSVWIGHCLRTAGVTGNFSLFPTPPYSSLFTSHAVKAYVFFTMWLPVHYLIKPLGLSELLGQLGQNWREHL